MYLVRSAQQSYESLKLTFGEHRCFLLQINSQAPAPHGATDTTTVDMWAKYLRRRHQQPSAGGRDQQQHSGEQSAPRTPQDLGMVNMVPYSAGTGAGSPLETPPTSIMINEEVVDHPLSPVQEHATEAIVRNP